MLLWKKCDDNLRGRKYLFVILSLIDDPSLYFSADNKLNQIDLRASEII